MAVTRGPTLFVVNRVDDPSGGTLRAATDLASALVTRGRRVVLTAPVRDGQQLEEVRRRRDGVDVRLFDVSAPAFRVGLSWRYLRWLAPRLGSFEEVHVHSVFYIDALLTVLLCRLFRIPLVVWPHGCLDRFDLARRRVAKSVFGFAVLRLCAPRSTVVVFTSDREAAESRLFGAPLARVVVALPVVSPALPGTGVQWRARHRVDQEQHVVLFLGRLTAKKNLHVLIEAMAALDRPDVVLMIAGAAGSPAEDAELRRLAQRRRTRTPIIFCGWLGRTDKAGALDAADLFVLPSSNENFGIAVVEALLAGVPVLISRHVDVASTLIAADAAFVCEPTATQLREAISEVVANREQARATARRGRRLCETQFSVDAVGRRLETCLAQARSR